jgi:hypothetical protein
MFDRAHVGNGARDAKVDKLGVVEFDGPREPGTQRVDCRRDENGVWRGVQVTGEAARGR